jgi:hypothetical protein
VAPSASLTFLWFAVGFAWSLQPARLPLPAQRPVQRRNTLQLLPINGGSKWCRKGRHRPPPNALPRAGFAPALEPTPYRRRRAVLAREVLPATTGNEDVEDALDSSSVIRTRPPGARWGRQEGADEGPLPVSETNPAHASRLDHPSPVLEPPVVLSALKREPQGAIDTWIPTAQRLAQPHPDVRYDELPATNCRRSVAPFLSRWSLS